MNVGRGYIRNVGRGYVIQNSESVTKVGIELLGHLKTENLSELTKCKRDENWPNWKSEAQGGVGQISYPSKQSHIHQTNQ